jgi:ABC-type nitrate/sulfonate/bicarbonate transport system substrate-binding protein
MKFNSLSPLWSGVTRFGLKGRLMSKLLLLFSLALVVTGCANIPRSEVSESVFSSLDCPAIVNQLDQARATRENAAQAKRGSWKVIIPIAIGVRYFNAASVENEADKRVTLLVEEQRAKRCSHVSDLTKKALPEGDRKTTPISVVSFPSPHDWPIWIAQELGYFSRNGITVSLTPTPDSKFQLAGLIEGNFDIAMTGIDNVIAYTEGQGEVRTQQNPDLFAFMGASNKGFLRLVTSPEIKKYADLKGKQLSVDAQTTGYSFVLRELLKEGGLGAADVEFVSVGGLRQRYQTLVEHKYAGTLLISPLHAAAQQNGFNVLANVEDVLGHYQASVGAARRDWAKNNHVQLVGYIRAYMQAIEWLRNPKNKAEAIAILSKNMPNLSGAMVGQTYEMLLVQQDGLDPRAELDISGIETVLALRSEYGKPQKTLSNAGKYYDLQYHAEATESLR